MANTGGFDVVAEISEGTVDQILLAARKSNVIPQGFEESNPIAFGPYLTEQVDVVIPEAGLSADLLPASNSVRINIPVQIDVQVQNPPVPSASLFNMTADLRVDAPLGTIPGQAPKIGVLTQNIGPAQVGATLTSGDPIPPITEALIAEYVHARWEAETIPHVVQQTGVSFGGRTFDVHFQTFDDENIAAKRISVVVLGNDVTIGIPCALQLSNITGTAPLPPSPLAVVARLTLATQLDVQPGRVRANLATATVTVEDLAPGEGIGGTNYSPVAAFVGPLIETQLQQRATAVAQAVGLISVDVPTVTQIESFIAAQLHAKVAAQPNIGLWTPDFSGAEVTVNDATPKVLAGAVAIAINARSGADISQIDDFIPAGDGFAVAMLGAKVIELIEARVDQPQPEGLGGIPQTRTVEGKEVRIHRLDFTLRSGAIRGDGDLTVVDAVAGSIDIDAGFWADIGLRWVDEADGQKVEPFVVDDDVSLSAGAWIVMIILGFVFGGLIIGVVLLVVYLVVEGIADSVGAEVIEDETGQVKALSAWPTTLDGIGDITSRFENPIVIEPGAIVFSGSILVTSMFALTASAPPDAQGPYFATARQPINLSGGVAVAAAAYEWRFGDGAQLAAIDAVHEYTHSGVYVSRLGSSVAQPGGVSLGNLALVKVRNVPADVSLNAPMTVREGQRFDVVVDFTDAEWLDVHEVVVDFGDDSQPAVPAVTETNAEPAAVGRATASHAYCDGGTYTIRVQVIDSDGGVGVATHDIEATNVAPVVTAPERMYAYHCSPLTLIAPFTDAGWCDTHTGSWDFGDCSPVVDATIRELHEPPEGVGYAAATHTYHDCGRFEARVVVVDDDGGVGSDTTIVEVVDVRNRTFEHGFRVLPVGEVANEWAPVGDGELAAAHSVLREGRAAQVMRGRGRPVGIRQTIGANPGWDYQLTAHCHAPAPGTTMAVGVDPNGGDDPAADEIVWMRAPAVEAWRPTTVRATATASRITVFVMVGHAAPAFAAGTSEAVVDRGVAVGYVDEVALVAVPCPLPKIRRPKGPAPDTRRCIDWKGEKAPQRLGEQTERGGVTFRAAAGALQLSAVDDVVVGLLLPARGLFVELPAPAGDVTLSIVVRGAADIRVVALDAERQVVATASSTDAEGPSRTITLDAMGAQQLAVVTRSGADAVLVELCWKPAATGAKAARS